uniref:Xylose isomerase domain protein TIM barrel n=1 Tax=Caulobacter sp. (strain K31) TaxID=366602 RepID=B0T5K1_CAUSK
MSTKKGLKLGTTLYSLTNEFHWRKYDFEGLVRRVAAENLGPGLEVVGFQSIKGFPVITDAYAEWFKALIAETGLELSCLGINADNAIRRDRDMTVEESVTYHQAQIDAAAKLGFPVARYQYPAGVEVIRRLEPYAAEKGVKLGLEIHSPHTVHTPDIMKYRELYDTLSSPYLGFVPDFGSSVVGIPPMVIARFRAGGASETLIDIVLEEWRSDAPVMEKQASFRRRGEAAGANVETLNRLAFVFGYFSRQAPQDWAEIMHQVVHIHGKFFDFNDQGEENSVPYPEILKVFVDGGYDGYMSSEYEGHLFSDDDGFDKLLAHHAQCQRILDRLQA